jgi:O-acetyl-ADP-ribose deacetylase (regulator of RNase III)
MPIEFLKGDLFQSDAQTLAHGCNCRGKMGAGIAKDFRYLYPDMYKEYRRLCYKGLFTPGDHYLFKGTDKWVLNLATQDTTKGAQIQFIQKCFADFADYYEKEGITSLAMPRIGAGLGGLKWEVVKGAIIDHLEPLPIQTYVYEEFVPV